MGLDITAYRQLRKVAIENETEDDVMLYHNPSFPGRADDVEPEAHYAAADETWFRAGSYIWYSHWREMLAEMAGYPAVDPNEFEEADDIQWAKSHPHTLSAYDEPPRPFAELIAFSDCEGVIGSVVSAKLAKDFADFQEKADAHPDENFRRKYAEWRKAFEMASDGGAVSFH